MYINQGGTAGVSGPSWTGNFRRFLDFPENENKKNKKGDSKNGERKKISRSHHIHGG